MTVREARRLRKNASLPERLLWNAIKASVPRIRRQHPIGDYIVDFYCPSAKLAFEIDGIAHDMGERPARDNDRDRWLETQGVTVVRIAAADVLRNASDIGEALLQMCRTPPPRR